MLGETQYGSKKMSPREKIYLSPLEKYRRFGRFPWKIIIHILLLATTTCQVVLILNKSTSYSLSQYTLWNQMFLDKAVTGSTGTITNSYNIFSATALEKYVKDTVLAYYNVNGITFEDYDYKWEDGFRKTPLLRVKYLSHNSVSEEGLPMEYHLTRSDFGPFMQNKTKEFLDKVDRFTIELELKHHIPRKLDMPQTCYLWKITQRYNLSKRGPVQAKLDIQRDVCNGSTASVFKRYLWVSLFVGMLGFASFVLTCKDIMERAVLFIRIKNGYRANAAEAWERVGIKDKLRFFKPWIVITIIGNLCNIFGAVVACVDVDMALDVHEYLIGFGAFFAWINIVSYLEHSSQCYAIINTLKRSIPIAWPYIVGLLPIYMGYVFLGIAVFWPTGYFATPLYSMMALFALVNGDTVYLMCQANSDLYTFIGMLYSFTFIVLFITCVLNVFLAIINEGYTSLKFKPVTKGDISDEEDSDDDQMLKQIYTLSPSSTRRGRAIEREKELSSN